MQAGARLFDAAETALLWGLAALVIWAPMPLASNRMWSWSLLGLGMALLLLLWSVLYLVDRNRFPPFRRALFVPVFLFGLTCLVVAVQAVCLPGTGVGHPVWGLVAGLDGVDTCSSFSVERDRTWTALGRLLTYGAAFWLAIQVTASTTCARRMLTAIALSISGYAAYGLLIHFMNVKPDIFFEHWDNSGFVTSTFINRNSFAAFAGMGAVACLGRVLHKVLALTADNRTSPFKALAIAGSDHIIYVAGGLICLTAVVLTASRAGVSATLVGLVFLVATTCLHHKVPWRWWVAFTGAVLLLALLIVVGGGNHLLNRVEQIDVDIAGRQVVIGSTLEGAARHPWIGVGYGAFEDAWPAYRPPGVDKWFRRAHSTYAENLLELGYPAAIALTLGFVWVLACCLRGLVRRRRNGIFPSVAFAAVMVPVVHSTIDFSLQMPAVMLTVSVLLGIGFGQSFSTRAQESSPEGAVGA